MICQPCRNAADARAPRDAHCHDPACMCGHRVDRYQPKPVRPQPPTAGPNDPPCNATWAPRYSDTVNRCHLIAGHFNDTDMPGVYAVPPHPGGWHTNGDATWADRPDNDTTPHQPTPQLTEA